MVMETLIKPRILDQVMIEDAGWNDAGLSADDLAEWLSPRWFCSDVVTRRLPSPSGRTWRAVFQVLASSLWKVMRTSRG